ncbi:MAG: hypothetical protein IT287_05865 [Bdellovibrionaceae bacterium]|nr:hypothetical protein [Pseudobdellovibrionaceae bacterium]
MVSRSRYLNDASKEIQLIPAHNHIDDPYNSDKFCLSINNNKCHALKMHAKVTIYKSDLYPGESGKTYELYDQDIKITARSEDAKPKEATLLFLNDESISEENLNHPALFTAYNYLKTKGYTSFLILTMLNEGYTRFPYVKTLQEIPTVHGPVRLRRYTADTANAHVTYLEHAPRTHLESFHFNVQLFNDIESTKELLLQHLEVPSQGPAKTIVAELFEDVLAIVHFDSDTQTVTFPIFDFSMPPDIAPIVLTAMMDLIKNQFSQTQLTLQFSKTDTDLQKIIENLNGIFIDEIEIPAEKWTTEQLVLKYRL